MRKQTNTEIKSLMSRIERLARKEDRDIVGQITHMIKVYEAKTGVTGKRTYTKVKPKQVPAARPTKSTMWKDKGVMHPQARKNISTGMKLSWARRKLAALNNSTS